MFGNCWTASTTAEEVITPENESKLIINESKINVKSSSPGWETILDEGFPLGWPSGKWSRSGKSPCRYTWDEDDYKPYQGTYSAWCADISLGGCSDLDPSRDNYPNDMDGWMKYGPFDLSDATDARMTFYYWSQTESNFYDYFFYGASHDGSSFSGTRVSGYSGGWRSKTLDLSGYCGDSSVWVGFKFHSGSSITYKGTFVDEVIIQKYITTVPTPVITGIDPPQPTASPTRQGITILGSGFVSDSKVTLRIGSSTYPIPSDRTEFKSSTKIRVYVGLTDHGTWTVQVTNPGNRLSNIFSFTVKPPISTPVITSITPSYGPAKAAQLGSDVAASDSTRVTVIGSNFGTSQGYVKFWQDGTTYHNAAIESWSNSQIVCRVPGGVSSYNKPDGTGNVYVRSSDGRTSNYARFRVTYSYGGGKWPGNSVTYRVNPNTADCIGEETAVQAAANTWNNAGANFRFVYGGTTSKTSVDRDGENSVIWRNYGYTGWIARAWTYTSTSNPRIILENDLEFNDYYTWSTSLSCPSGKYDVQNIATHEFGHWLNLKDLYGTMDSEKTMYGRGASCETKKRTLEPDDIAGFVYIYGSGPPPSSLTVNVKNTAGYNLPSCGGKIEVVLYDKNWKHIETKSKTYSGGESSVQVKFDNLANDKYYIEIYQTPNAGLKLSEFWGGDEVTVSGSTTKNFVRHTQWVYDIKIDGKRPYENEIKVNLYEIVHVDVTVKNDEGGVSSKNVKARLMLDRDKSSPYDLDETHGPVNIPKNGYGYFGYDFYASKVGTHYFYIVAYGYYNNKYIVTDQWGWDKAFNVLDTEKPSVTVTFPNGGEKFQVGMGTNILWTATDNVGVTSIDIYYSTDSGSTWKTIATGEANDGTYTWTIPNTPSKTCRVKVVAKDAVGNLGEDTSNANFEIYKPDTTPPSASISINSGATYTTTTSVTLSLTYSDSGSGVDKVRYKNFGESYTSWESPSSTKSWTLRSGTGSRIVYYQVRDKAGNIREVYDSIVLDTTLPSASISINNGATYTTTTSVTLSLTYSDSGSGIDKCRYKNSGGSWTSWQSCTSTKAWTLSSGDGTKTVYYQVRDNAGNIREVSDTIILDTTKPSASISINSGATYTTTSSVTLSLTYSDSGSGVDKCRYKNSGGSWTGWESCSSTKSWTLSSGDGTKTVYYQVRDKAGNIREVSDTITLDTTDPSASISINSGATYTTTTSVTLSLAYSDGLSGVDKCRYKNSGGSWTSWQSCTSTKAWTLSSGDGTKTVYYQVRDKAGKIREVSDAIILDTTSPSTSISINNGATYTTTTSVTLSLTYLDGGSGVDKCRYRNSGGSWTSWQSCTSTKSWTLSSGDGTKTVYYQVRDKAGNIREVSDTIILDTTPPTISITSPTSGQVFTTPTITVSGTASDNVGLSKVEVKVGSGSWQTATGTTSWSKSVTLASGSNTIYAKATDTSGNTKETSVTVTYNPPDTTPPTISITSPTNGQVFTTAIITVSGTASDNVGLSKVEVKVGSGSWQTASGTTSWSKSVTLASGSNTIYAKATDTSGNTKETSVTVTYNPPDTTPPTVTVTSPNGGETWNVGTTHYITWTTTDNVGVTSIDIYYSTNGGSTYPYTIATGEANDGTYSWAIPDTPSTTCRVKVIAYDAAGNTGEDASNANFEIHRPDTTPPVISSVGSSSITKSSATVTWSTDEISDSLAKYGTASGIYPYTKYDATDVTSHSIDLTGLSASTTYYYVVNSTDPSGNSAESAEYNFTTLAEITPPTITSVSPVDGATGIATTTTISTTFSEVMNTASAETAFSITPGVAGTFSWVGNTMTFTPSANLASSTTYTVTIAATATDLAGNPLVAPYAWSFTTAVAPPVLTSITVSPSTATLYVGNTQQFTATAYDQYGNTMIGIIFTWTSSNLTVGTIDANGLFTAKTAGENTVMAANGTICGTADVIVTTTCIPPNVSWNMTISATNQLEPVVVGMHPDATDSYDPEYDVFAQTPVQGKVILIVDDIYATSIQNTRCYNESVSWNLSVGVPTGQTTTLSWIAPSNVNLAITEGSGILYSGVELSEGSHELLVTAKLIKRTKFSLELKPGWNMVSLPVIPDNNSVDAIFGSISTLDTMPIVTWQSPSFVEVEEIEPKIGYWVFTPTDTTITVTGKPITATTLILEAGWNMVGTVGMENLTISDIPNQVPQRPAVTWVAPSFVKTDVIEPGKSAWMFVTTDTFVTVGGVVSTEVEVGVMPTITKRELVTPAAITNEWNITISATNQLEPVTFGIHPDAANGYDEYDVFVQTPIQGKVIMILDDIYATEINRDKLTWNLSVGIPIGETTTLMWDSSKIPADVTLTLNGIDMKSQNSMEFGEGSHLFVISGRTGEPTGGFDTGLGTYPSIFGTHNGAITPNQTITVQKLYTYPCAGTGGHTEHVRIWNDTWAGKEAYWKGYQDDWHNISFDEPFTLFAEKTYYYEIRTGSYPQIIHKPEHTTLDGSFINCTNFIDANGKEHTGWIPAIRLFL